jgi:DNA-directed RNA polymerase specialized sigma24 family protein
MSDDATSRVARDARDEKWLRALAAARRPGREDPLRARDLIGKLVGAYLQFMHDYARGQMSGMPDPLRDAEDIASEASRRLVKRLLKDHEFPKLFWRVVLDYVDWTLTDFWKSPGYKVPADATDLETVGNNAPPLLKSEAEQARDLDARLSGLSGKDRRIVLERLYVGRTPLETAQALGIPRERCDEAYSRAVKRLREGGTMADARKAIERSEGKT